MLYLTGPEDNFSFHEEKRKLPIIGHKIYGLRNAKFHKGSRKITGAILRVLHNL